MSTSLVEFFTRGHRDIDSRWAEVETAADAADRDAVRTAWSGFNALLREHLDMEEQLLFPAFENATGMTGGPTEVMRGEHTQMRGLLDQMASALDAGDIQELVDQGDTILMLIQQHNSKEEGMLYPMSENALASEWPGLEEKLLNWKKNSS
ncbi:MAG: hemerythrin domain-containing protein [bacterium]|nr:hemerythrin domain-containing protein [bacterium]